MFSLSSGKIVSIGFALSILGLAVIGATWLRSVNEAEVIVEGLPRTGRVLSKVPADPASERNSPTLRVLTDFSPTPGPSRVEAGEVEVSSEVFDQTTVGANISLRILSDGTVAIEESTVRKEFPSPAGSLFGFGLILAGLILLVAPRLARRIPPGDDLPPPDESSQPRLQLNPLEKLSVRESTLYDGAFEFSYSAEKTHILLTDGTEVRINQYRPLAEVGEVLADRDLLEILRSAKSDWTIPEDLPGRDALESLISDQSIKSSDQFFLNGDHLGLLSRGELDNGHWHSWVRGLWKISPLSQFLSELTSPDSKVSRSASRRVLMEDDFRFFAALASDLPHIRAIRSGTAKAKREREVAAEMIEALSHGKCPCFVYSAQSVISVDQLLEEKKIFESDAPSKSEKTPALICSRCLREQKFRA